MAINDDNQVHHIVPFGESWEMFIDAMNLETLCHSHHTARHRHNGYGRVKM